MSMPLNDEGDEDDGVNDEDEDDDDDDVAQAHTPTGGSALNGEQQHQHLQRGREEERAMVA